MIAYAGSFVLMEETAEKSEKTEKSEEALHSIYHSKGFRYTLKKKTPHFALRVAHKSRQGEPTFQFEVSTDFNVNFIYYTSYLDCALQATT